MWRIEHKLSPSSASPLVRYVASYFSAHTVLAKTLFEIADSAPSTVRSIGMIQEEFSATGTLGTGFDRTFDSYDTWTATEFISSFMSTETLDEIDIWNGYSNSLLLLINEIVSLREDVGRLYQCCLSQAKLEAKIRLLQASLERLSQSSPASLLDSDHPDLPHQRRMLESNAEAYRLAAILFLNESSSPSFLGRATTSDASPVLPLLDAAEKRKYVSNVLDLIREIVTHTKLPPSWPLWALFIAGCCTDTEEDRVVVLSLLQSALQKKPYENIPRAQKVIELVWQHRDAQLESRVGKRRQHPGMVGRYEWEVIMDIKGWRPSFA